MERQQLAALLKSRHVADRFRAVQRLASTSAPFAQELLLSALRDSANYVATLAAEALGQIADDTAADAMVERFLYLTEDGRRRDPGCHIRSSLAFGLGRLEYGPASSALRQGIRTVQIEPVGGVPFDTGAHLRANCALALAQLRAVDAVRDIAILLFDMSGSAVPGIGLNPTVKVEPRKAAAQALARLADASGLIPLTLKLTYPQDEAPEVLQECMLAVVDLEDPRALELLTPYLGHDDEALAAYAGLMIARLRAIEAPRLLSDAARRMKGDPLRAIVIALTTLRTDEARAALYSLAGDERIEIRLAAVEALAMALDDSSRECLQRIAEQDPAPGVRRAARSALE